MGVPKFYRWISERYPCLSEFINNTEIPEFDNLYLDMNGIIHNCSHPNDDDISFTIPQEQIFTDIFAYIEMLFKIVRPKKVFFLAVDGVAPRAKLNQQRSRRFLSARTAEEQLEAFIKKGGKPPIEKRFDPNCITPGTIFMAELHNALTDWLKTKIEKDVNWRGIRVYLSGHDCPGEGEHKIMDFIRHERSLEGYDPNTRHCLYGLDADLIMLGICSHEPHFSLLREEVKFNRPQTKKNPARRINLSQIKFHLLHISLLREYLAWEFHPLEATLSFPFDVDRIVDDWVLMSFLVGNDFIPHLPHVHIHDDALPLLYQTYIEILPTLGGYINESGVLNLKRFEVFLGAFAKNDRRNFLQKYEDECYLKSKTGKSFQREENRSLSSTTFRDSGSEDSSSDEAAFVSSDESEIDDTDDQTACLPDGGLQSASVLLRDYDCDEDMAEDNLCNATAAAQLKEIDDKAFENDTENCWTKAISNSFRRHKRHYYREKMNYENITKSELREQAEGYVKAVQWNLYYYYRGCISWSWFYPHHYAPYISDVVEFSTMDITFELGEPLKPLEQLLAVLPSASSECLPPSLRDLMCSKESPIADFYPTNFTTDLNGKKNDWEAVVLIPFINKERLLSAMESKLPLLSAEEKSRNSFGSMLLFDSSSPTDPSTISTLPMDAFYVKQQLVKWGLLPNTKLDVHFPGFPTMKHLPHNAELKKVNVKVFHHESKSPSMVLNVEKMDELNQDVQNVADSIIDREVYIEWPILKLAKVHCLWADGNKYTRSSTNVIERVSLNDKDRSLFNSILCSERERLLSRFAINVEKCDSIVFVRRFVGITYTVENGMLRPKNQWASSTTLIPVLLPLVVTNIKVEEVMSLREISVVDAYPKHSKVFVMLPTWEGFGYPALVDAVDNDGRVRLTCSIWPTVDLRPLRDSLDRISLKWMNSFEAGRRIGVDGRLLSRITGTVYLLMEGSANEERKSAPHEMLNIGLSLKLSKKNKEVADYTRRVENGYWEYSALCVKLLSSYRNKFRDLFSFLEKSHSADDSYLASDVWTNETKRKERLSDLKNWLASVPTYGIQKQDVGTQYVDSYVIEYIENAIQQVPRRRWGFRKCSINPNVLYRAELYGGKAFADPDADFLLLDRVVYCVQGTEIPFGLQGTVIAVYSASVDVLFDKEFECASKIRSRMSSGASVPKDSLINISYGKERKLHSASTQSRGIRTDDSANRRSEKKDSTTPWKNQNAELDKRANSATECTRPPVSEQHQKIQILKAQPTVSSDSTAARTGLILTKEVVENELTKMLGLTKINASKDPTSNKHNEEPLAEKELSNVVSSEICKDIKNSPNILTRNFQSTAMTKLFPQLYSERVETKFKSTDRSGSKANAKYCGVSHDPAILAFHRGASSFRGKGPRTRASVFQVAQRPNQSRPLSTAYSTESNQNSSGNSRSQLNAPKLTDLKPSSVILPYRKYRGRRGARQATGSMQDMLTKQGDSVPEDKTSIANSTRVFVNTRARRVRKSRLAPKFSEHN